jgi:RHS repeat-associated protein
MSPWGGPVRRSVGTSYPSTARAAQKRTPLKAGRRLEPTSHCLRRLIRIGVSPVCPRISPISPGLATPARPRAPGTAGYTYLYDGDGNRVEKASGGTGTLYWPDASGEALVETDLAGGLQHQYAFFNGKRVARRDADNSVRYYFSDHLGSASIITNEAGAMPPIEESDYYPYGGEMVISGGDANHYKFTGKERDQESGLDDFGARFDASSLGRFMSPDEVFADQHAEDPQSWNLYIYTVNNPVRYVDPNGQGASDFLNAAGNAIVSDNLGGAGRQEQTTTSGKVGAAVGDFVATVQGAVEDVVGGGGEVAGVGLDSTGVGALAGVPVGVGSTVLIAHGTATAGTGFTHLLKAATEDDTKVHGNTAGNQPAELYEKYDKDGNFEKHGVSQDASKRYSSKEVDGGNVQVVDRGPRREMLDKERERVETNPGPKNRERWAGKRKIKCSQLSGTNHSNSTQNCE